MGLDCFRAVSQARAPADSLLHGRTRGTAFTLVELLVVIGIITVLVALLLPALNRARAQSSKVQCLSNLRQIGQGLFVYAGQNHDSLPFGFWSGIIPGTATTVPNASTDWSLLVMHTLNPNSADSFADYTGNAELGRELLICPDGVPPVTYPPTSVYTQYSCHPRLMPNLTQQDPYFASKPYMVPYKLAQIQRSDEVGVIFDGSQYPQNGDYSANVIGSSIDANGLTRESFLTDNYSLWANSTGTPNYPISLQPKGTGGTDAVTNLDVTGNSANIRFRHMKNTMANVLFADGHADSFTLKSEFQTDLVRSVFYVNPPLPH